MCVHVRVCVSVIVCVRVCVLVHAKELGVSHAYRLLRLGAKAHPKHARFLEAVFLIPAQMQPDRVRTRVQNAATSLWWRKRRSSYPRRSFAFGSSVLVPCTDGGPRALSVRGREGADFSLSVGFTNIRDEPVAHGGALFSKSSSTNTPSADCGADCACIHAIASGTMRRRSRWHRSEARASTDCAAEFRGAAFSFANMLVERLPSASGWGQPPRCEFDR